MDLFIAIISRPCRRYHIIASEALKKKVFSLTSHVHFVLIDLTTLGFFNLTLSTSLDQYTFLISFFLSKNY